MTNCNLLERHVTIEYAESEIARVVDFIGACMPHCHFVTLQGPLGAGKTTLVRELLHRLGVAGPVVSPTFSYVHVYKNAQGATFYHLDLYRLRALDDFFQAGLDEFLNVPNSWVLIEWPELVQSLLTQPTCQIVLDYADKKRRADISISCM